MWLCALVSDCCMYIYNLSILKMIFSKCTTWLKCFWIWKANVCLFVILSVHLITLYSTSKGFPRVPEGSLQKKIWRAVPDIAYTLVTLLLVLSPPVSSIWATTRASRCGRSCRFPFGSVIFQEFESLCMIIFTHLAPMIQDVLVLINVMLTSAKGSYILFSTLRHVWIRF